MKKLIAVVVFAGFMIGASMLVSAQEKAEGPKPGHVGEFGLFVRNAEAVKALQLSADQEKQFDAAVKELKVGATADRKEAGKNRAEFMNSVKKILTPDQLKKAQVLTFQSLGGLQGRTKQGPGAAVNLFALEALNITPEQKKEIQEINKKTMTAVKDAGASEEGKKKIETLRKEQAEQIVKLLTPDQKQLAEKLHNETPDFLKAQGRHPKPEKKLEGKKEGRKEGNRADKKSK